MTTPQKHRGKVSIAGNRPAITMLLPLFFMAIWTFLLSGCISSSAPTSSQDLEAVAQGIDKALICPICPSETIDQSQVKLAKQMRAMVREKLAQGESRSEILQFFVDRYGLGVLAEPPRSGFNLLVWVIPPIALLVGIGILAMTVQAMRRGQHRDVEEESPLVAAQLEPYLSAVDQEIQRLTQTDVDYTRVSSNTTPEGPDIKGFGGMAQ